MKFFFRLILGVLLVFSGYSTATADEKLRVGTEGAYPPFNWIDKDGKLKGFDVDIARALCAAGNFECSFVIQDWDGIIPGLLAKKFDVIIASMSITGERKQVVDFTNKYYQSPARFVASEKFRKDIPQEVAAAAKALDGLVVGVQRATIHENFVRDNFPGVRLKSYATQDEANLDLVSGRLDLVLADSVVLSEGFLKKPDGAGFKFVGGEYSDPKWFGDGVGIALRKGNPDLLNALNQAIDQIRADGTYKKISDRYFDFDIYGE